MEDPTFKKAVILICDHQHDGSFGFIINKKLDLKLNDLLADFPEIDLPVYYGGPVDNETTLHFLHTKGDLIEDSVEIINGVYWGGNFEQLRFLVDTKLIGPDDIRFYLGYSGWDPGQIKDELKVKSWIVDEAFPNYVYARQPEKLWQEVLQRKGDQYAILSEVPEQILMN